AFENTINISCRTPIYIGAFDAIRHQTTSSGKVAIAVDRRHAIACGKRDDLVAINVVEGVRDDDEATVCALAERSHDALDLSRVMHLGADGHNPKRFGRALERVQETRSIRGRFKIEHQRHTTQVWCGPF